MHIITNCTEISSTYTYFHAVIDLQTLAEDQCCLTIHHGHHMDHWCARLS